MTNPRYTPSSDAVMLHVCAFGVSVPADVLVETLIDVGYKPKPIERRIQCLINQGELHLAKDVLMQPIYVRTAAVV